MGFFDNLFGGADNAAQAQIQGIQNGLNAARPLYDQANTALTTNYTAGLQPFLQNYGQAQKGVGALGDVLGLNGPAGSQSAKAALETRPGYQFQLGQGNNAINAAAAANGTLGSGNQAIALQKFGQQAAGQNYNDYVGQLQPYLGASQSAAGGIGGLYAGLGGGLSANDTGLAKVNLDAYTGIGNAQASADLADQKLGQSLLGNALNFGLSLFSDARLKEDIEPVGELYDGQQIYRYRYIGDDTPRIGLMAQEVADVAPDAVGQKGEFLAVDYGKATNAAAELARYLG